MLRLEKKETLNNHYVAECSMCCVFESTSLSMQLNTPMCSNMQKLVEMLRKRAPLTVMRIGLPYVGDHVTNPRLCSIQERLLFNAYDSTSTANVVLPQIFLLFGTGLSTGLHSLFKTVYWWRDCGCELNKILFGWEFIPV